MLHFNRGLAHVADWALVGIVVLLLSMPVITVPAAVAAGIAASHNVSWRQRIQLALCKFRRVALRGTIAGIALAAIAGSGGLALLALPQAASAIEYHYSQAVGTALIIASIYATSYVACALSGPAASHRMLRSAYRLAVLAPQVGLFYVVLAIIAVCAAGLFPLAIIPTLGAMCAVAATIPIAAARRLTNAAARFATS